MRYSIASLLVTFSIAMAVVPPSAAELPSPGTLYHVLFATSGSYSITSNQGFPPSGLNFGNIDGASWQVTYSAANAGLPGLGDCCNPQWNGRDIKYQAILAQNEPVQLWRRLPVNGPVYNTQGIRVATRRLDLFDGSLEAAVDFDEFGQYILHGFDVWTGSLTNGSWSGQSCGEWNNPGSAGQIGDLTSSSGGWLQGGFTKPGNIPARLYGISPELTAPLWGDYDSSGQVDGGDFLLWQRSVGQLQKPWDMSHYRGAGLYGSIAGVTPDTSVQVDTDRAYLMIWKDYFGQTMPPAVNVAVPEPRACALLLAAIAAHGCWKQSLKVAVQRRRPR